jgi:hypothetical protein
MLEILREDVCVNLLGDYFVLRIDIALLQDEYQLRPIIRYLCIMMSSALTKRRLAWEWRAGHWLKTSKFRCAREDDAGKCDADRHMKFKIALWNRIHAEKPKGLAITRTVK